MPKDYNTYLERFRREIREGGRAKIEAAIASGDMVYDVKIRAANHALVEDDATIMFPLPPDDGTFTKVKKWAAKKWHDPVWSKVIATGILLGVGWILGWMMGLKPYAIMVWEHLLRIFGL